ncbi:MAG: hypothetical protein IK088_07950 [Lachnospiraceae bacterium]|nr:hypothetical protein [Lachnospiraceae bacterium]
MEDKKNLFAITDRTAEFEEKDIQDNKVMGILAYLFLLVLVPIFAAKESKYARFHANQGLVLLIIEGAVSITMAVLGWIPVLGWIVDVLGWIINVGCAVLAVFGIVFVAKGQAKELPVIGKFQILK